MSYKLCSNFLKAGVLLILGSAAHAESSTNETLPETIVTATRFEAPYAGQAANVTVITADDIRNSTAQTLPDLLATQAGVTTHDFFGNNAADTSVDMRGFGAEAGQNTLILIDGRRLTDIDLSGVQWSAFPLASIDRIEIERGGAVLYGDGASAGVINIITRNPIGKNNSATLGASAGSDATYEEHLNANVAGQNAGINFTVNNTTSDGWRDNNQDRQSNALADFRWRIGDGELALKAATDSQGLRLPGARTVQPSIGVNEFESDPRGTSTPLDWSQRDGNRVTLDWNQKLSWGEFIVGGGWRGKTQRAYYDFGGFPNDSEDDLDVWSFLPRLRIAQPLFGFDNSLVLGFDLYRWDYARDLSDAPSHIAQPINHITATQDNRAFYAQNTTQLTSATTLALGARSERFSIAGKDHYDASAPDSSFLSFAEAAPASQAQWVYAYEVNLRHQWQPQLALLVRTDRSYRFANVDETYETSPAFTPEFQFLKPQINHTVEAGVEWTPILNDRHETPVRAARLRATVFQMNVDDEIHLDAYTSGIGNTNLPPSRRRGVELQGRWQALENLTFNAGYTWTQAQFREGVLPAGGFTYVTNLSIADKTVPLVPKNKANVDATWTIVPHVQFDVAANYVGSQYMDNDEGNTGTKIPAYTIADAKLSYINGAWRLSGAVNNLFNRSYYEYAVRSQFVEDRYNVYPLPGRTFRMALEYTFQ